MEFLILAAILVFACGLLISNYLVCKRIGKIEKHIISLSIAASKPETGIPATEAAPPKELTEEEKQKAELMDKLFNEGLTNLMSYSGLVKGGDKQ